MARALRPAPPGAVAMSEIPTRPAESEVEAAIARVVAAEQSAKASIAAAREDAAAMAEQSRAAARALAERTQQRIRRLRAAFEERVDAEVAALQAQGRALAGDDAPDAAEVERVAGAVAALAAQLTGAPAAVPKGLLDGMRKGAAP
jgi:hypothetical protein